MAFVIAEPCIGTKDTSRVDACPVDCLHRRRLQRTTTPVLTSMRFRSSTSIPSTALIVVPVERT